MVTNKVGVCCFATWWELESYFKEDGAGALDVGIASSLGQPSKIVGACFEPCFTVAWVSDQGGVCHRFAGIGVDDCVD